MFLLIIAFNSNVIQSYETTVWKVVFHIMKEPRKSDSVWAQQAWQVGQQLLPTTSSQYMTPKIQAARERDSSLRNNSEHISK